MSAVSNQKMEKSITKMADRGCQKCGKVDYKQLNSVSFGGFVILWSKKIAKNLNSIILFHYLWFGIRGF